METETRGCEDLYSIRATWRFWVFLESGKPRVKRGSKALWVASETCPFVAWRSSRDAERRTKLIGP